jgi:hypothetical protein
MPNQLVDAIMTRDFSKARASSFMTASEQGVDALTYDEPIGLTEQEVNDLETAEIQAAQVIYSGQDFDVVGLIRRLQNEDILIPSFGHEDSRIDAAGFQRSFVWNRPQMDKFIESIILGYPIPGIFLVKQPDKRYLVLDGQQRLTTLRCFKEGIHEAREFSLRNVANEFKGLTYKNLPDDFRRQFENTFIQAIIVTSDGSRESMNSVYNIFERLNSGGTQLTPHEIRVALYAGPFIDYIEELNRYSSWRSLYGSRSSRLRDQELVLRAIALFMNSDNYKRPLKKFLNDFVADNRDAKNPDLNQIRLTFQKATDKIFESAGRESIRLLGSQVTAAFAEVIIAALMDRLSSNETNPSLADINNAIQMLKNNSDLTVAFTRSTADEEQLTKRLTAAREAFARI